MPGLFIQFEGPDGAGKSTQLALLAEGLRLRGIPVLVLKEPGGTPLATEVRRLVLESTEPIAPEAELFLFLAARAQLFQTVIAPALAAGTTILCDRGSLSTYVYQVEGRGLPADAVLTADALARRDQAPDAIFLFTLDQETQRARLSARGGLTDRMEADQHFLERVRGYYGAFAESTPVDHPLASRIVPIDARDDEHTVHLAVLAAFQQAHAQAKARTSAAASR